MTKARATRRSLALVAFLALGCDGRQYVSPATVALVISDDATQVERVNRCHFIPVLLGSRVSARYRVDDELRASIDITRDEVTVFFEGGDSSVDVFTVDSATFDDAASELDLAPPRGYAVELRSPCSPEEP
jgi:hypothetical protein